MFRIGHGYDVHAFVPNRPLYLGGVEIPYKMGLLGHSDADVLTHALCDALLGAACLGDIGHHFPDTDPAYKGIRSILLLEKVVQHLAQRSWVVQNADITVIAEEPKLKPHLHEMHRTLENVLSSTGGPGAINIKGTTQEGLGFVGRQEGIAVHAVALIQFQKEKNA